MTRTQRSLCTVAALTLLTRAASPQAAPPAPLNAFSETHNCLDLPHADHPKASLHDGPLSAVVFLPDQRRGFYRGSRFDWAGVIGCLSFRNHTFFGEWFPRYDPLLNDAITGPVEEFRAPVFELGYDDPSANGRFLKIGVGLLHKVDEAPYTFGAAYPIVDAGTRTTRITRRAITFTQRLDTGPLGYAYLYEKTLMLDRHGPDLILKHKLTNLGRKTIETDVYDHDFFMLDNQPTRPGMIVRLGFVPTPEKPFPAAAIQGNEIVFLQTPTRGNSPQGYLTGYTGVPGEYDILLEDTNTHLSVEQTSNSPLSKFYFWSTPKTICPEAYIHINIPPGQTQTWEIKYRFKAQ